MNIHWSQLNIWDALGKCKSSKITKFTFMTLNVALINSYIENRSLNSVAFAINIDDHNESDSKPTQLLSVNLNVSHTTLWAEFLSQCEDISLIILFFWPRLWLTFEGRKWKFAVRSRSIFFSNFGHLLSPLNPVLYFYFKNINFFKIAPKLTFLQCFFHGTIFLAEEFLLS